MNEAGEVVTKEIHHLDHNADAAFESVNEVFKMVAESVERRRQEVLSEVKRKRDEKKKVLDEQLKLIQSEKEKVESDVQVCFLYTT